MCLPERFCADLTVFCGAEQVARVLLLLQPDRPSAQPQDRTSPMNARADGVKSVDGSLSLSDQAINSTLPLTIGHLHHRDIELIAGGGDTAWLTLVLSEKQFVECYSRGVWSYRPSKVGLVSVTDPNELTRIIIRGGANVARLFVPLASLAEAAGSHRHPTIKALFNEREPRLARCAQRGLVALHQGDHTDPLLLSSIVLELSSAMVEKPLQSGGVAVGGLSRRQLRRVEELIESRLSSPVASSPSLSELAAEASLSMHHFAREFRRTTGATPYAYALRRRLDRARGLVVGSEIPIAKIGALLGFPSAAHFSDRFQREMGVAPRALRRAAQSLKPRVCQAGGFHDAAVAVEPGEPGVAVGLEDAPELAQVRPRVLALAVGGVAVGHRSRVGPGERPVIAHVDPEPRGAGAAQTGLEHRHDGVVGVHAHARHDASPERVDERPQQARALPHHVGHCQLR